MLRLRAHVCTIALVLIGAPPSVVVAGQSPVSFPPLGTSATIGLRSLTVASQCAAGLLLVFRPKSKSRCLRDVDCDDGNACNGVEVCKAGVCEVTAGSVPAEGTPCDDGNPCTVNDACFTGICSPGGPNSCDDGNPCTDDTCDFVQGCQHVNDDTHSCDDGLFCTGTESCNAGTCIATGDPCAGLGLTCVEAFDSCGLPIGGTVTAHDGAALSGVTLLYTGTGASAGTDALATTDATGVYQAFVPQGWSGTVSSDSTFRLEPVLRTYANVSDASNASTEDYQGFRNYYVDNPGDGIGLDGDDGNPGTRAKPFATIQQAAGLVNPGDTVYVKAGTYREWVKIRRSGTAAQRILFRNFEDDAVVIDADAARFGCIMIGNVSIANQGDFVTVDGFELTNTTTDPNGPSDRGAAASMFHVEHGVFRNLTVHDCGFFGIQVKGRTKNCTVEYCEVFRCGRGGIFSSGTSDFGGSLPEKVTIDNCLVYDSHADAEDADGIQILLASQFDPNTGVTVASFGGHRITNCIVHHNSDDGLDATSVDSVLIARNIVFQNGDIPGFPPDLQHCPVGMDGCGDGNGIKVSTNAGGDHTVVNNIIFNNERGGLDQDIIPGALHNRFYGNIAYGSRRGAIIDTGAGGADTAALVINNIFAGNFLDDYFFTDTGASPTVLATSDFNFVQDGLTPGNQIPIREGAGTIGNQSPRFLNPPPPRVNQTDPFQAGLVDTTDQGHLVRTMDFIRRQVYEMFSLAPDSPCIDAGFDLEALFAQDPGPGVVMHFGAFDDPIALQATPKLIDLDADGTAEFSGTIDTFDIGPLEFGLPTVSFLPDDDTNPDSPSTSMVTEGAVGGLHTVTVVLNFDDGGGTVGTPADITVDVRDLSGSAHGREDYDAPTQTLVFPAGSLSGATQPYTFTIYDDVRTENAERVNLGLHNVTGPGMLVGPTLHTATIQDND